MDTIIRGLLLNQTVNIIAISGKGMVERAREIHSLSRVCTAALGRTLLAVSMMSAKLKSDGDVMTVTISGNGPAGSITVVGREGGIVKGYIANPTVELPLTESNKLDVGGAVGHVGDIRVIRDFSLKEPYVGSCHLVNGEIAEDFARYFAVSEQQPSLVYLGVRVEPMTGEVRSAAGLILAPLPNCPDEDIDRLEQLGGEIYKLSERMDEGEELETALNALFDGFDFEITERLNPEYRCDCSREKLEGVLVSLGPDELRDIIEEDGQAEIVCRFCNTKYQFGKDVLTELLHAAEIGGSSIDK
ncbi:MAG: Hsp33 family molecular chaperone HslO [Christensenellales bacterium]